MTVWDFGQREVWSTTVQRLILTWIKNSTRLCQPSIFTCISYIQGLVKGRDLSFCVHWRCIALQRPHCHELWAIRDFKLISGLCEPAWCIMLPGPSLEVSSFQLGSFKSTPPPTPPLVVQGGGVRVPQVPHITPQLRPPVQPKANQHAASWPPVDAGRLNVTHIIIHYRGELGKEGRDGGAGVRGGGPGPDSLCPGQLKSLQPPLWTYSTSPTLTRSPRPSLSSDG